MSTAYYFVTAKRERVFIGQWNMLANFQPVFTWKMNPAEYYYQMRIADCVVNEHGDPLTKVDFQAQVYDDRIKHSFDERLVD
jgi:hypothetical protein